LPFHHGPNESYVEVGRKFIESFNDLCDKYLKSNREGLTDYPDEHGLKYHTPKVGPLKGLKLEYNEYHAGRNTIGWLKVYLK